MTSSVRRRRRTSVCSTSNPSLAGASRAAMTASLHIASPARERSTQSAWRRPEAEIARRSSRTVFGGSGFVVVNKPRKKAFVSGKSSLLLWLLLAICDLFFLLCSCAAPFRAILALSAAVFQLGPSRATFSAYSSALPKRAGQLCDGSAALPALLVSVSQSASARTNSKVPGFQATCRRRVWRRHKRRAGT